MTYEERNDWYKDLQNHISEEEAMTEYFASLPGGQASVEKVMAEHFPEKAEREPGMSQTSNIIKHIQDEIDAVLANHLSLQRENQRLQAKVAKLEVEIENCAQRLEAEISKRC